MGQSKFSRVIIMKQSVTFGLIENLKRRWKVYVFSVMAVVLFYFQFALVVEPIQQRSMPVELDDSLVYIVKATQMEECFFQECKGLEDIKNIIFSDEGEPIDWQTFLTARNFLHIYHVGHSAVMVALHSIGIDWEPAFDLIRVVGSLFILFGLVYWVYAFFGLEAGTVMLALCAFSLFPEQGIHIVTPSNISLGIGLFLLGAIARGVRNLDWWIFVGILIALSLHSLGVVIALLVWTYYLFVNYSIWTKRGLFLCALSVLTAVAAYIAQHSITSPMFAMPFGYEPAGWNGLRGHANNINRAWKIVIDWFDMLGGVFWALPVILYGIVKSDDRYRSYQWILLGLLVGLLFVSLLLVFPPHPALLFRRIWFFGSLLGLGFYAQGLWFGVSEVVKVVRSGEMSIGMQSRHSYWKNSYVYVALFSFVAVFNAIEYVRDGHALIQREISSRIARHEYDIASSQVAQMIDMAVPTDRVMYAPHVDNRSLNAVPALYYFIHGAMDLGATLQLMLDNNEIKKIENENTDIRFAVAWNPLMKLPGSRGSGIKLGSNHSLQITLENSLTASNLSFKFLSVGLPYRIEVIMENGDSIIRDATTTNYWRKPLINLSEAVNQVVIYSDVSSDLLGIKLSPIQKTRWPWRKDVHVSHMTSDGRPATVVSMDPNDLIKPINRNVHVINDQGATVLAELL